jgi:hypothetical protein
MAGARLRRLTTASTTGVLAFAASPEGLAALLVLTILERVHRLSSRLTFFYKWVFTSVWIVGFTLGTLSMLLSDNPEASGAFPTFLVATVVGSAFLLLTAGRLKVVDVDGTSLIVSNFISDERIPLRAVLEVRGSIFFAPELVFVRLRDSSSFGTRITFMPPIRVLGGFSRHLVVHELREMVDAA